MDMNMGSLKPGATYIYERDGHKVYAREFGSTERKIIGYDYDGTGAELEKGLERLHEDRLWADIRRAAKDNPTLQDALDRVKVIYELSKANE